MVTFPQPMIPSRSITTHRYGSTFISLPEPFPELDQLGEDDLAPLDGLHEAPGLGGVVYAVEVLPD